jgi:hypothetical protein
MSFSGFLQLIILKPLLGKTLSSQAVHYQAHQGAKTVTWALYGFKIAMWIESASILCEESKSFILVFLGLLTRGAQSEVLSLSCRSFVLMCLQNFTQGNKRGRSLLVIIPFLHCHLKIPECLGSLASSQCILTSNLTGF